MSEQEFHIPVDEIAKNVPVLLRGEAKKLLQKLDNLDLTKDGKRDVAQIAKLVFVLLPLADKINDAIDFDKLADFIAEQPFIKDKAKAVEIIKAVCHAIEKV